MVNKEKKGNMLILETNTHNDNPDQYKELYKQWSERKISLNEYAERVRALGGEVLFGSIHVTTIEENRLKIEKIMGEYQNGNLSIHELRRLIEDAGGEAIFWDWELDRNPNYAPGDSRIGFTWNPRHSKKGMFMQHVTKRVFQKMVDFIHNSILKYDSDAFVFTDTRLQKLKRYTEEFIIDYIRVQYKKDLIRKITDICLFFLKEDVYYRVLVLRMINTAPSGFDITDDELHYFEREIPIRNGTNNK